MFRKYLYRLSILILLLNISAIASDDSLDLENLAFLSSGTSKGYKTAAIKSKAKGSFDAFAFDQGGDSEIYKDRIDPAAPNTLQAISNVKNTLAGNAGNSLLQDANNKVAALQTQITQRDATINTATTVLDTSGGQTLPGATQAVNNVVSTGGVGGNRGSDVLTDVTAARDALPNAGTGDLKARSLAVQGTINAAITTLDATVGQTLPGATQAVSDIVSTGGVGGNRGADVLTDVTAARNALPNSGTGDLKARVLAVQGTINTAITTLDATVGQTLPGATQAVNNIVSTGGVGGNRGADVLTDVTAARNALPNSGTGDLKARVLAVQGTINTAITTLDTTVGQTLPGATQAVNNVVSTGGVGGNRGANVLTDVTAARDALPNAGAGDLKARVLAVQGTINTAITTLDTTVGQTLPGATQAVNNVVSTGGVGGNRGADVLTDVTAARNALPNSGTGDLKARAVAIGGMVSTAINTLDSTPGQTLPGATQAVNDIISTDGVGGNRGLDTLSDVTTARNALPNAGNGDLIARALAVQGTINAAITTLDTTVGQTLPGATQAVNNVVSTGGVGGNRGADVLTDVTAARNALPNSGTGDLKARVLAVQGTINTAITTLDATVGQTLPGATQAVNNIVSTGGVGGNRGADVLTDVTAARNALPNSGTGDLKARALAVQGTIHTAITTLDTTVGQTLPGATQAVNDIVSTGGVGGNRGADVLTDVTAARNALPNSGTGDLKARALAVGSTISATIADIDPAKATLPTAVESIMDTQATYASVRTFAGGINANYILNTTSDASLRNEVAIIFNILQTINTTGFTIQRIDGSTANAANITLADLINFLSQHGTNLS